MKKSVQIYTSQRTNEETGEVFTQKDYVSLPTQKDRFDAFGNVLGLIVGVLLLGALFGVLSGSGFRLTFTELLYRLSSINSVDISWINDFNNLSIELPELFEFLEPIVRALRDSISFMLYVSTGLINAVWYVINLIRVVIGY